MLVHHAVADEGDIWNWENFINFDIDYKINKLNKNRQTKVTPSPITKCVQSVVVVPAGAHGRRDVDARVEAPVQGGRQGRGLVQLTESFFFPPGIRAG